jgi:hypothetical protein
LLNKKLEYEDINNGKKLIYSSPRHVIKQNSSIKFNTQDVYELDPKHVHGTGPLKQIVGTGSQISLNTASDFQK